MTKIKSIKTARFDVQLFQTDEGKYFVQCDDITGSNASEDVDDYTMATYLFDLKVQELQGN